MALADDPWDATELAAYIPEVWSPIVNEQFFANAVATNFFTDLSSFVVGGGDTIHVPNAFTNAFTVQSQATQATVVTTDAPATVDDTISVNTHSYIAHLLGDKDMVQILRGTYNINEIYAKKAGGTLMENLEAAIFALQSSVTTNTVNDTASVINDVDLRSAMSTQETNDVPRSEMAFFFHPYSYFAQIHAIQKYYDASQAGWSTGAPTISGNFGITPGQINAYRGTLYGVPIYTSSNVVNTLNAVKNLLAHKNTFMWAAQTPGGGLIRTQAQYLLDFIGTLVVHDLIRGVGEFRQEAAVRIDGSNAFFSS